MSKMLTAADLPPLSDIPLCLAPTLAEILRREGTRFEDDPKDPGGATKCGISLAFARAARLDLDGNGATDLDDIRDVTPDLARRLIFLKFYREPGIDALAEAVQPVLLDTAFNCGIGGALQVVHQALSDCALHPYRANSLRQQAALLGIAVGHFGAGTTVDALVRARIAHYRRIATNHPAMSRYLNGWVLRALHYASDDMRRRYDDLLKRYGETP